MDIMTLFTSLDRRPTIMTVWMLNRILNATKDLTTWQHLINKLKNCSMHSQASEQAKRSALDFYAWQTE